MKNSILKITLFSGILINCVFIGGFLYSAKWFWKKCSTTNLKLFICQVDYMKMNEPLPLRNKVTSQNATKDDDVSSSQKSAVLFRNQLLAHVWLEVCVKSYEDLNALPLYPNYPHIISNVSSLDLFKKSKRNFVQRILGIINPTETGNYSFWFKNLNSTKNSITVVLWLGNTQSADTMDQLYDYNIKERNQPGKMYEDEVTEYKTLVAGTQYNIELLVIVEKIEVDLDIKWCKNNRSNCSKISSKHFQIRDPKAYIQKLSNKILTTNSSSSSCRTKYVQWEILKNSMPQCLYTPSYMPVVRKLKRYSGSDHKSVSRISTEVYPPDGTYEYVAGEKCMTEDGKKMSKKSLACEGSRPLEEKEALEIVRICIKRIEESLAGLYKLSRIIRVERRKNGYRGSRYFVEMEVKSNHSLSVIAEYIYLSASETGREYLCFPAQFQWKKEAMVNIILTAKNQPSWVKFFIDSFSDLFVVTGDARFNVIIVDFGNYPLDVEQELQQSQIPHYRYIQRTGMFYKTQAIQDAAATVTDPDGIIFLMDLHIQIPHNLIDVVRKHCIQGRMAFSPIVLRFPCGGFAGNAFGRWEIFGYGLFAIYKSDWDIFGGMNVEEFKYSWGGEDSEMLDRVLEHGYEVERLRLPNFFHYHHSRGNLWNKANK